MARSIVGVLLVGCLVPTTALADQCAWVDAEQATEATRLAVQGRKFVDYCEPCGDPLPRVRVKTIETVEVKPTPDGSAKEVFINGEAKDLAYVFVQTVEGSGSFENLAAAARCKTEGVSRTVTVQPRPSRSPRGRAPADPGR